MTYIHFLFLLQKVQTQSWTVGGNPAGTWVASRNLTYAKIFNASHMVGFDVLHVAHDMILRFMGVNFSALADGSARIPSAVGGESKVVPVVLDGEQSGGGNGGGQGGGGGEEEGGRRGGGRRRRRIVLAKFEVKRG